MILLLLLYYYFAVDLLEKLIDNLSVTLFSYSDRGLSIDSVVVSSPHGIH